MSWASSGSQSLPQITLMTFQPAPRKNDSSSWMIFPLPRTGPSSRCRLQLMTKMRLSSSSRAASPIDPSTSGSSVSPSPRNAHTRDRLVSFSSLASKYRLNLAEPSFQERPRVDAGGGVPLDEDLVARLAVILAAEEVVEADLVQAGGR